MTRSEIKTLRDQVNSALELLDRALEKVHQFSVEKDQQNNPDQVPGNMKSVVLERKFEPGTQVHFLLGKDSRIYTGTVFSESIKCVFGTEEVKVLEHVIEIRRGKNSAHISAELVYETKEELIGYLETTANEEP